MGSDVMLSSAISDYEKILSWENLLLAYRKAACGKRRRESCAAFEYQLADRLILLRDELEHRSYQPGKYRNFQVHSPKRRTISAAPFRDRVVHHALLNVIEPKFERSFIEDSYANRVGKGTHRAVKRLHDFARQFRYVLRLDIVKHFPSIDHAVLKEILWRKIEDEGVRWLIRTILARGAKILQDQYEMLWFPGDSPSARHRPRGLPIGNLTSQFWSNCYLNPFDHFVKRELGCKAYLRYVDDMALFCDNKPELWAWKRAIDERLACFRLITHPKAQVFPTRNGIPWLGFIVYPTHRLVKARNARNFSRRLRERWGQFCQGKIRFAELDATVKGWVNHVRYADTWGLRRQILGRPVMH